MEINNHRLFLYIGNYSYYTRISSMAMKKMFTSYKFVNKYITMHGPGPFEDIAPQILIFNLILVLTGTLAREPLSLD
jgi:hypothetical protein